MSTDEEKKPSEVSDEKGLILSGENHGLSILVTEADKHGMDIAEMSNFFDGYIGQLTCSLRERGELEVVASIPIADLSIVNDVIHQANAVMKAGVSYLPDFEHLPTEIKEKLRKGLYKLGESKQVDGNVRAVILDENGVRIKDITLKQVINTPDTIATERSIANQLQMRQLSAKLNTIQALQNYQLDRDRDRDILGPFFEARDYILKAQNQETIEGQQEYLKKAAEKLSTATTNAYLEMRTASQHLVKWTRLPIFQPRPLINRWMNEIAQDMQLTTKFTGLQAQVYERLGDKGSSKIALEQYSSFMGDFFTKPMTRDRLSAADVIHMNFPYSTENLDGWHKLKEEVQPLKLAGESGAKTYLISMEDTSNDE